MENKNIDFQEELTVTDRLNKVINELPFDSQILHRLNNCGFLLIDVITGKLIVQNNLQAGIYKIIEQVLGLDSYVQPKY